MIDLPPIKRGDTFALGCSTVNSSSLPEDLTEVNIRSQVRSATSKTLIEELSVVKSDQTTNPGEFSLTALSTLDWPIGNVLCDIQFIIGDVVISSDTMTITILRDVTYD